jgi:hypothetical protein
MARFSGHAGRDGGNGASDRSMSREAPGRERQVHSPDAVLNVLTPRPEK